MIGGLDKLSSLREAPGTILALNNELSDFRLVCFELSNCLEDSSSNSSENTRMISAAIMPILDCARTKIMELECLIRYKLILPSTDGSIRLNKATWICKRQKVKRLRDEVRSIRMSLIAMAEALIAKSTIRIELQTSALCFASEGLRDELSKNRAMAIASSSATETLLRQILHKVSQTHGWKDLGTPYTVAASTPSSSHSLGPQLRVPMSYHEDEELIPRRQSSHSLDFQNIPLPGRRGSIYPILCTCCCHLFSCWTSPKWLGSLLGHLSVGYAGLSSLISCDKCRCRWSWERYITIQYAFPFWCALRLLHVCLRSHYGAIEHTLRLSRIVWAGSKIFWQARWGDADGIRTLLAAREGSPYDVTSECGATALNVCFTR